MGIPPSIPAVANDLGERCQVAIGPAGQEVGYIFENGSKVKFNPQVARSRDAAFISSADFLTMRDWDYWSRTFINDWRRGFGQVAIDPTDKISKSRYWDSSGIDISYQGQITVHKAYTSTFSESQPTNFFGPLVLSQNNLLYLGDRGAVKFSGSWSSAPNVANISGGTGSVYCLATDGRYLYGGIGDGTTTAIDRWLAQSTAAGTQMLSAATANIIGPPTRMIYANRKLYCISNTAHFYEINTLIAQPWSVGNGITDDFSPPQGNAAYQFVDIEAANGGGAIDSPILILANQGSVGAPFGTSIIFYWDGSPGAPRDYIQFPSGFFGLKLKNHLGVIYVLGYVQNPDFTVTPCAYYIANGSLGFLGYFGLPLQANGNPGPNASSSITSYAIDAWGTSVYFGFLLAGTSPDSGTQIWRYDSVNGGLSRFATLNPSSQMIGDIRVFSGWPWVVAVDGPNANLYKPQGTFNTTGTMYTSDINIGQPWADTLWVTIEIAHSILAAGESIAVAYSVDQGATYTTVDKDSVAMVSSTVGSHGKSFVISGAASSIKNGYIRLRFILTAGTSQLTTPKLYGHALKGATVDSTGVVMECVLTCPDKMLMPNGSPDWQGLSGQERIYNITNAFQNQNIVNLMYLAPSATRPKNPVTITVKIIDYELLEPSSVNVDPNFGVQGSIRVVMRQAV